MPFGDVKLLRWLMAMPADWGRGERATKYPLKAMLARMDYPFHLQIRTHDYDCHPTHEIIYHSYVSKWFKALLYGYPYEQLLSGKYFNLFYLRSLVDEYRRGVEHTGEKRQNLTGLIALCVTGWKK